MQANIYRMEKEMAPAPVFLPGQSHGQRSLAGCSPHGRNVRHDLATKQPPLYTRCLNNKVLLWSPGNCVQYPVMNHSGKEHENAVKVLVVSNSLQLHELYFPRLLCLWDFLGKHTGVGCHFLLQGIYICIHGLPWKRTYIHIYLCIYISNIYKLKYMNVFQSFQYTHNSLCLLTEINNNANQLYVNKIFYKNNDLKRRVSEMIHDFE